MSQAHTPLPEVPQQRPLWLSVLAACGVLSILACGGLVTFVGCGMWRGSAGLAEGQAFLKDSLPQIADPWNLEEIRQRTEPEAFVGLEKDWAKIVVIFQKKLGNLKSASIDEPTSWRIFYSTNGTFLELACPAEFDKGSGQMTFILRETDAGWKFRRIGVDSPALRSD